MADIKLMVMYPCPHDIRAFEKLYEDEDMPMRDGLSSEYAMSFEAFEKLYHDEHVPMVCFNPRFLTSQSRTTKLNVP